MLPVGLEALREEVVDCQRCPRLASYLTEAREKHPDYWGRPVPGFGDPAARLLILGLAPAYHGGNRHGRIFTGDQSGAWLWGALHELGLASAANSTSGDQPLVATGVYVTNAVRCAPPGNRPVPEEVAACRSFLERELALLTGVRVVLALGRIAHATYVRLRGDGRPGDRPFAHGAVHRFAARPAWLVDSYHPSRQNTNTRVLTWEMWIAALDAARRLAGVDASGNATRMSR
jgi:uracil-DNA glycosylase family 4